MDLSLYNSSGVPIGSGAADLNPLEMRQIGAVITSLGGPDGTKDAFLVVSTTTADARIATYAAVIDQNTNDPRTILPATLGTLGTNGTWILPSSAHAQGANNAFYTTDLTIGNAGTTMAPWLSSSSATTRTAAAAPTVGRGRPAEHGRHLRGRSRIAVRPFRAGSAPFS